MELCCVSAQSTAIVDNWSFGLWITGFGLVGLAAQTGKGEGSGGAFWLYLFVKKDQDQIVCTYASYSA
jgi:hypothetical protein